MTERPTVQGFEELKENIRQIYELFRTIKTAVYGFEDVQSKVTDSKEYFLSQGVPDNIVNVVLKATFEYGHNGNFAVMNEIMIRTANWTYTRNEISSIVENCFSDGILLKTLFLSCYTRRQFSESQIREVAALNSKDSMKEKLFRMLDDISKSIIPLSDNQWDYQKAFFGEYRDNRDGYNYLKCFEGYLNRLVENYSANVYYSPIISIIQSSGMGKSRSFKELAKKYLTFYVVFREMNEKSFPQASKALNEYLLFTNETARVSDYTVVFRYVCFLKSCIDVALKVANNIVALGTNFYEKFYLSQVNDDPDQFWTSILTNAQAYERSVPSVAQNEDDFLKFVRPQVYLQEQLEALKILNINPLKVLFVLDEVHCFSLAKDKNEHLYVNFCRALQIFDEVEGIMCATADTASKLSDIIPKSKDHISGRVALQGSKLLPPFYRLGTIDSHVISNPKKITITTKDNVEVKIDEPLSLDSVVQRERVAKYGRPLWWSLLKENNRFESIISLAQQKLLGVNSADQLANPQNLEFESCLAILSSRLQFAIKPNYEIAAKLTESHGAVVDFISSTREALLVSYTSEPIVAEAAAILMEKRLTVMLGKMLVYFRSNFIDSGERSEYIARLVSILAADKVSKRLPKFLNMFTYNRPISCEDYLKELVGDHLQSILAIHEKSFSNVDWRRFLSGKLFFTHYIGCNYTPTLADLAEFFKRGAAVLCKTNQAGVDMIIPVLLPTDTFSYPASLFYSPVLKQTERNLNLKNVAILPEHDEFDIPQDILPFSPCLNVAISGNLNEKVAKEDDFLKNVLDQPLSGAVSSSRVSASNVAAVRQPSSEFNGFIVSPINMSYILIQVKFRSSETAESLFQTTFITPSNSLRLPSSVPYCSLLLTHADGGPFMAKSLPSQQPNSLSIGVQGFNEKSFGPDVSNLLQNIVAPDMSYFGHYKSDVIKMAYANMHPLSHWCCVGRLDSNIPFVQDFSMMSDPESSAYQDSDDLMSE